MVLSAAGPVDGPAPPFGVATDEASDGGKGRRIWLVLAIGCIIGETRPDATAGGLPGRPVDALGLAFQGERSGVLCFGVPPSGDGARRSSSWSTAGIPT